MREEPTFGDLLRRYRVAAGMTQEELAERAGLSVEGISTLERGARRAPRRDTLRLLAEALGLGETERAELAAAARGRDGRGTPARPTTPSNLPPQPTPFIGRELEVEAVRRLLLSLDSRLLTLTGPGGIGKTRLALEAAAGVLDRFPDGVYFISLASTFDPSLVIATVARTLGVVEAGARPIAETLMELLRGKRMLLVLDNLEQVLDAGPSVGELVASCPRFTVLVTSRAPLRVRGEQEYEVPPLRVPDPRHLADLEALSRSEAVAIFVQRAAAVRPGFALTAQTAPAIAAICRRLDGLPLAIELAAARVRLFPPQVLLARLDSRLKLLTAGAKDLPARQQTLRSSIGWSYDLLNDGERELFARLAVFVGGRTLEAIEAVCDPEGGLDALEVLGSLVEKSLLRREEGVGGEPRFVMLETIHEYARERLEESGEAGELMRRHAEYYLALAERAEVGFRGPQEVCWLERLEEERENLRAALSWALEYEPEVALRLAGALWWFWYKHGHLEEGRRWLDATLARSGGQQESLRAKALNGAGVLADNQGDYDRAASLLGESLTLRRALADKAGVAQVLNNLGALAMDQGDYTQAAKHFAECLDLRRDVGDKWGAARALSNLAATSRLLGDHASAAVFGAEGLALMRELEDRAGIAQSLSNLGDVAVDQGDYERALALYAESIAAYREVGETVGVAWCLEGVVRVAGAKHQSERMVRLLGAAEALRAGAGAPLPANLRPEYERNLADARARLGDATFETAWEEGRAMMLEEAVEYALGAWPEIEGASGVTIPRAKRGAVSAPSARRST